MRIRVLNRDVGRYDDADLRLAKGRNGGRGIESFRSRAEVIEDAAEKRVAAVSRVIPLVMEIDLLAICVSALLTVEPGIEKDCMASSKFGFGGTLPCMLCNSRSAGK